MQYNIHIPAILQYIHTIPYIIHTHMHIHTHTIHTHTSITRIRRSMRSNFEELNTWSDPTHEIQIQLKEKLKTLRILSIARPSIRIKNSSYSYFAKHDHSEGLSFCLAVSQLRLGAGFLWISPLFVRFIGLEIKHMGVSCSYKICG